MKRVSIPIIFGRADRVDPKLAPAGVLKTAKNLRVRKDGRLASRTGYQPLAMADCNSETLVAYDLHEFSNGRLCALGSTQGESYPTDLYEYRGLPAATPWRPTDGNGSYRYVLSPFTYPKQVCGAPQPAGGIRSVDCAAGGGYVCTVYQPASPVGAGMQIQIVRESDDQVIAASSLQSLGWKRVRVCWSVDRFFFIGHDAANSDLELGSFTPGVSNSVSVLATVEASAPTAPTLEIEAVANPSASRVIVAYVDSSGSQTVSVKRYNVSGTQQGSSLTLASQTNVLNLAIEADEVDNTVNMLVSQHDGSGVITSVALRSYNFSNSLLDGPTACNAGYRATLCRVPARTGWVEHVAVASSAIGATGNLVVQWINQDTHAVTENTTIGNAMLATAMVCVSSEGQPNGVALGGFVSAEFDQDTNALFYVSGTMVHMATRDLRNSARNAEDFYNPLGLSLDSSTGRIAWASVYFTGDDIENYTVTTVAVNSSQRRQSASAGGMLYLTGGPVQVYDGHSVTEVGFTEVPGIKSISQSTSGSLEPLATYSYVMVWEYALPDGTFYESPPSPPVDVTLTGANDETVVTVFGPHSTRVAMGNVYGAQVTGVLYRTVWSAGAGTQSSTFHEVQRFECQAGLTLYGDDIVVNDGVSDASAGEVIVDFNENTASVRRILYVQDGPVEHNAPEMASYISSSSGRVTIAGLARQSEVQESKELTLDQAVNFNGLSSFITRCPNPVNGVVSLDSVRIIFTRTDVYVSSGEGPENDASGALPQPVEVASPGGLKSWTSLLKGPDGVWFQLDDNKLYRMPRGSGAPEWLGVDVQDTLAAFTDVTGAARCRADDALVFACSSGTAGRMVVRSLRTSIWTEDNPPLQASQGIAALTSYGDRVAYISGGIVYAQHATSFGDGTSGASVIETQWVTHPIYPFQLGGNGQIHDLQLTGEYRSAGTLALRISYDDGITWNTYDTFTLSGLTTGATVHRRWEFIQSDVQSAMFEVTFTPSSVGEGFILNELTMRVDPSDGLRDLDPSELA